MTHRCRDCDGRPDFSLKTGNLMEGSKPGYRTWAIAVYLVTTGLKGVSSMKLHRDLAIARKSAWHLAHRIRKAIEGGEAPMFAGPAEADETCVGGKRRNMSNAKRKEVDRARDGRQDGRRGRSRTGTQTGWPRGAWRRLTPAPCNPLFVTMCSRAQRSTPTKPAPVPECLNTLMRRSIAAPGSSRPAWLRRTAWRASGPCSSAAIGGLATSSPRSALTAMSGSSRAVTTSARRTPQTGWRLSPGRPSATVSATGSRLPTTACLRERAPDARRRANRPVRPGLVRKR